MAKSWCIFLFTILLITSNVQSQNRIKGEVLSNNNKVDYFIVEVLKLDSTIVQSEAFYDNKSVFMIEIPRSYSDTILLKISSLGYQSEITHIDGLKNKNIVDIGRIHLKAIMLNEIEVVAKLPTIINKPDRTRIDVKSSILRDAIDGVEMLRKTPGLLYTNNTITVAGKGTPIIYIDGKQARSYQEVQAINPMNIDYIEVIDNPSSAYDADGQAVVLIKTKKRSNVQAFRIGGDLTFSRKTRENINAEGQVGNKNISSSLYYSFRKNELSTKETNTRNAVNENILTSISKGKSRDYNNIFRFSTDYKITDKQTLGYQLDGYGGHGNSDRNTTTTNSSDSYKNFKTESFTKTSGSQINNTLYYINEIDTLGQKLSIIGDFTLYKDKSDQDYFNTIETINRGSLNENNSDGKARIFSIKSDYNKPISIKLQSELGVKYSYLYNDNTNNQIGSTILFQKYNSKENNIAAYINMTYVPNPRLTFRAGVRAEQIYRVGTKDHEKYIDISDFNLFPSFLVNYKYYNNYSIGLAYTKRISRPSLSSMDPSLTLDSLLNRQGNPDLKYTIIHNFQFSINPLPSLSLRLGYSHRINPYYFMAYQGKDNPNITYVRFENSSNSNTYNFSASYNQSIFKWWSCALYIAGWQDFYKYYEIDIPKYNDNLSWYFNLDNSFNLPYKVSLNLALNYNGGGSSGTIKNSSNWNLYGSLRRSFLKDAMAVVISVNDVFREGISKQRSVLLGNNLNIWDGDESYVRIGVSYNFGKTNYKSRSGNNEERNRL